MQFNTLKTCKNTHYYTVAIFIHGLSYLQKKAFLMVELYLNAYSNSFFSLIFISLKHVITIFLAYQFFLDFLYSIITSKTNQYFKFFYYMLYIHLF
jgi:hypothetical protein